MLEIKSLSASRHEKRILRDINMTIKPGEIHVLMGPNGSGKSTLASSLIGSPEVTLDKKSKINLDNVNLLEKSVHERALAGLFVAFQNPVEVPGVSLIDLLRVSYNDINKKRDSRFKELSPFKFRKVISDLVNDFDVPDGLLDRYVNHGFSGGEKKKAEILQMIVLQPKYAILDEIDSGLDVSAVKDVFTHIQQVVKALDIGVVIITHYERVLKYINPTMVHIMIDGKIVSSGGTDIIRMVEDNGYKSFVESAT